jgi:hypothetical protein
MKNRVKVNSCVFTGNQYIQIMPRKTKIIVKATDGVKKIVYQSIPGEEHFGKFKWIDDVFFQLADNQIKTPTKATAMPDYKLIKSVTLRQVVESIPFDLDDLCLTQSQIIEYVVDPKALSRRWSHGLIFILKELNEYIFVHAIKSEENQISFLSHPFTSEKIWDYKKKLYFVLPI